MNICQCRPRLAAIGMLCIYGAGLVQHHHEALPVEHISNIAINDE
jgi:hypothetical protein